MSLAWNVTCVKLRAEGVSRFTEGGEMGWINTFFGIYLGKWAETWNVSHELQVSIT